MNSGYRRLSLITAAVVLAASALAPAPGGGTAWAQKEQRPPPETRKAKALSQRMAKLLTQCQDLQKENKFKECLAVLDGIDKEKLDEYEKATVDQFYGFTWVNLENYPKAIKYFKSAIDSHALSFNTEQAMIFNTAQLLLATEKIKDGIVMLEEWLRLAESPTGTQIMTIANAYVQDDRYTDALPLAERAVSMVQDPAESWLNLLVSLYMDRKFYKKALPHLEVLATKHPKKEYWTRLAAVYGEVGQEKKSLVALELAYGQGFLTEDRDLVRLAQLYLYNEIPYKAAVLLDKEMKAGRTEKTEANWELLGNSWLQSREVKRSLEPLSNAAKLAKDGGLWVRVAQVQVELEDWKGCNDALAAALKKGDLDDPGSIHILRGICLFNSDSFDSAAREFNQALKYKDYSKTATQWLKVISSKRDGSAE